MKKYLIINCTIVICIAAILCIIVNSGREKENIFEANLEALASPGGEGELPCILLETQLCIVGNFVFEGYDPEGNKIYRLIGQREIMDMVYISVAN